MKQNLSAMEFTFRGIQDRVQYFIMTLSFVHPRTLAHSHSLTPMPKNKLPKIKQKTNWSSLYSFYIIHRGNGDGDTSSTLHHNTIRHSIYIFNGYKRIITYQLMWLIITGVHAFVVCVFFPLFFFASLINDDITFIGKTSFVFIHRKNFCTFASIQHMEYWVYHVTATESAMFLFAQEQKKMKISKTMNGYRLAISVKRARFSLRGRWDFSTGGE